MIDRRRVTGPRMIAAFAAAVLGLKTAHAAEDDNKPPTLDCAMSYAAARAIAVELPGATTTTGVPGFDSVVASAEDLWRVEYIFTLPGHRAHPAVVLRTGRKQVTGVWTSDSKGCGYGDQAQFVALMADMKAEDTRLTNASRNDVEKLKQSQSPLAPSP